MIKKLNAFLMIVCLLPLSTLANTEKPNPIFNNILPYAELSNAIYQEKSLLQNVIDTLKFTLLDVQNTLNTEITYALLDQPKQKQHVIVVRGTSNVENVIVDMDFKLVPDGITSVNIHQGFLQASLPIFSKLKTVQPVLIPSLFHGSLRGVAIHARSHDAHLCIPEKF